MTFNKFLELHQVSYQDFSDVTGIPLRQVFRYAKEGVHPNIVNALKIKAFTDGKVILEDWVNSDDNKSRPTLQQVKSNFFGNKARSKKSIS